MSQQLNAIGGSFAKPVGIINNDQRSAKAGQRHCAQVSCLRKAELVQLISEVRDMKMAQRIQRDSQNGRYSALLGVVNNPAQYQIELQKIRGEVDTSLQAEIISQDMQNSRYHLAVMRVTPKLEHTLALHIAKKGAGIFNEVDSQREYVTKGCSTVTFKSSSSWCRR